MSGGIVRQRRAQNRGRFLRTGARHTFEVCQRRIDCWHGGPKMQAIRVHSRRRRSAQKGFPNDREQRVGNGRRCVGNHRGWKYALMLPADGENRKQIWQRDSSGQRGAGFQPARCPKSVGTQTWGRGFQPARCPKSVGTQTWGRFSTGQVPLTFYWPVGNRPHVAGWKPAPRHTPVSHFLYGAIPGAAVHACKPDAKNAILVVRSSAEGGFDTMRAVLLVESGYANPHVYELSERANRAISAWATIDQ